MGFSLFAILVLTQHSSLANWRKQLVIRANFCSPFCSKMELNRNNIAKPHTKTLC